MRVLLVCTVGGHLTQLFELQRRFVDPADDVLWITHQSAQSTSLLADHRVTWTDYIRERDIVGVARTLPLAWRTLRRQRPDLVVSTGSAIALAVLPLARLFRIDSCFVESAAMRTGHTRTGRILARVPGVRLYSQSLATSTGRWQYLGSVFDGFEARRSSTTTQPRRMVVMVGTSKEFGFRSLIERLVRIIPSDVEVLWQTGSTDVSDLGINATPWVPSAQLDAAIRAADVVISHAGAGSALAALMCGRRPILVPRRADFDEFNDDHQEEITVELVDRDLAFRGHCDELEWSDVVDATGWTVEHTTSSQALPLRR